MITVTSCPESSEDIREEVITHRIEVLEAMIFFKYSNTKKIANSQTQIYKEFTRSTNLRHLRCHNPKAIVQSLDNLTGATRHHLFKLCELELLLVLLWFTKTKINFSYT